MPGATPAQQAPDAANLSATDALAANVIDLNDLLRQRDVPSQDLITRDNVSVKVSAVLCFRVVDPQQAIIHVAHYMEATGYLAQTTLRSVLARHNLDALMSERERLNVDLKRIPDQGSDQRGIKVANVEIKHVDIDESMIRGFANQAEGEFQAAQNPVDAAALLATQPKSMQRRYLQTPVQIAGEKDPTVVFPIPIKLINAVQRVLDSAATPKS